MQLEDLDRRLQRIEKLAEIGAKSVLTIEEAVFLTGLSKGYLYRLTSSSEIPHYKPSGGKLYFKKSEIEDWLLRNRQHTTGDKLTC